MVVLTRASTIINNNNNITGVKRKHQEVMIEQKLDNDMMTIIELPFNSCMEMRCKREQLEIHNLELDILERKGIIEAARIANEAARIANEAAHIANEAARIANEAAHIVNNVAIIKHAHTNMEAGLAVTLSYERTLSILQASSAIGNVTYVQLKEMIDKDIMKLK